MKNSQSNLHPWNTSRDYLCELCMVSRTEMVASEQQSTNDMMIVKLCTGVYNYRFNLMLLCCKCCIACLCCFSIVIAAKSSGVYMHPICTVVLYYSPLLAASPCFSHNSKHIHLQLKDYCHLLSFLSKSSS